MLLREADKKMYNKASEIIENIKGARIVSDALKMPIKNIIEEIGALGDRKGERTIKWLNEKVAVL